MGIAAPDDHLLVPRALPEGTVVWEHQDSAGEAVEKLRQYDPRCSLALTREPGKPVRWEIWRRNEDGSQNRVGSIEQEKCPHPDRMIRQLAEHDTRRGYDPVADIFAADDAREAESARVFGEWAEEQGDKLHHALSHDLSGHAPAVRPIALSGRNT